MEKSVPWKEQLIEKSSSMETVAPWKEQLPGKISPIERAAPLICVNHYSKVQRLAACIILNQGSAKKPALII